IINNEPIGGADRIANHGGEGGARLAEFLINRSFGVGSFVIIVWLAAMCMKLLIGRPRFKSVNFTIKCFVALITVSLIVGISSVITNTYVNWGGYHAHYVYEFINSFLGYGSYILCFFMVALFVVICLNDLVTWIRKKYQERAERRRIAAEERAARIAKEEALMRDEQAEHIDDIRAGESVTLPVANMKDVSDVPENETQVSFRDSYVLEDETDSDDSVTDSLCEETVSEPAETAKDEEIPAGEMSDIVESESISASDADDTPEPSMVVNVNQIDQDGRRHYKSQLDFEAQHKYQFPPFSLMREGITKISVDAEEQMENKEKIQKTLLDFGIPITKIEATVGPTVTLYEIVPDKGVKIAKIRSLVDDIALSLSAIGVRIIAPIPGKGTVGIEVANKDPLTVSMQTVIKSRKYQESRYNLPVALGSTISNEVYIADLAKMPHLLVAGATGQGKSVGLNAIITSLLYCKSPSQLKFVMIDPKQVEFSLYNKLKDHYLAVIPDDLDSDEPVITDMQKVEATLNSLCIEMDNRYTLLKNAHARNIEEYNGKIKDGKLNPAEGHRFLPYIVVVVDEFGDLIMVSGKNVEMPIARLAQKARAVGMHVIIATQRPSTNVITGIIKANFPARISFKVSSGVDSKTILDTSGAQHLIGRGDMLIFNNSEMVRVQCAFIDTPEVESICEYIEKQPYAPGPYELPEPPMTNGDVSSVGG
ncbi:MAG: DNA translocase FtsK, partial [Muribaculaceae bacterium]|nr:DNA translocase FtsK [Muribaculaceae bacterium]